MQNNPYKPPVAPVDGEASSSVSGKLFTPLQVALGIFFGGPIAFSYFLRANFMAMGDKQKAERVLRYGLLLTLVLLSILPFLPDQFPNYAIPIALAFVARHVVMSQQMTKEAIAESPRFTFQSNWRVFGAVVVCALLFLAIALALWLALDAAGIMQLE
jgi:hypothetical protein